MEIVHLNNAIETTLVTGGTDDENRNECPEYAP